MSKDNDKGAKQEPQKQSSAFSSFALGATAGGLGATIVQPMDLVKTRMQVSSAAKGEKLYKNSLHCFQTVFINEGLFAFYKGLSAALLRQVTYTGGRLGGYMVLSEWYKSKYNAPPNTPVKLSMSISSGIFGALMGNPADVALIRMTADGRLPPDMRRNYTNVFNAIFRVAKEEGITTLWRGCFPSMVRGVIVNVTQISTYPPLKNFFHSGPLQIKDGVLLYVVSSMCVAMITTIVAMPVDMAKSRLQDMRIVQGKPEFNGLLDVVLKTFKREGFFAFWRGLPPYFLRLGPHTVLTFTFLEQLTILYNKHVLGIEGKGTSL